LASRSVRETGGFRDNRQKRAVIVRPMTILILFATLVFTIAPLPVILKTAVSHRETQRTTKKNLFYISPEGNQAVCCIFLLFL
jgi:hypothetical protein